MATVPMPPGRAYYLRIFTIALVVIVATLLALLFGVRMEASVPATGTLQARDQQNLRAPASGLVELGWFEGEVSNGAGKPVAFRVDEAGDGLTDPAKGTTLPIMNHRLPDGRDVKSAVRQFHALAAGDHLWPGQVVAWVQPEPAEPKKPALNLPGKPAPPAPVHALRVPQQHVLWQVLKVHVEPRAAVSAGTVVAGIAPIDPHTHEPVEAVARLEIAEDRSEEVAVGQTVRLFSSVYNPRFHGPAEGKLTSIEPLAEMHADGKRYFHATAAVTHAPYPLKLGSGVTAKIILGRKTVYRIILEH